MREVSVKVQGLCCTFHKGIIEGDLMARTEVKKRIHGSRRHKSRLNRMRADLVFPSGLPGLPAGGWSVNSIPHWARAMGNKPEELSI
jgi:hypothetical protein